MISLNEYIEESLLSGFDEIEASTDPTKDIEQFINDNYKIHGKLQISKKPNKNGKYIVNCNSNVSYAASGVSVICGKHITSLTNGMFEWGVIGGDFNCSQCDSLTSLEGAPKEVRSFRCAHCNSLISLKGAPEKVGATFNCSYCNSLTNLEGSPKDVMNFVCYSCDSLISLKGAPKKVLGYLDCSNCKSLKTLKGAPKEVGEYFDCTKCGNKFDITEIEKICKVKGRIIV